MAVVNNVEILPLALDFVLKPTYLASIALSGLHRSYPRYINAQTAKRAAKLATSTSEEHQESLSIV